jgi:cation:H+ antiporter
LDAFLQRSFSSFPLLALLAVIGVFLYVLGKGADLLVEEAVSLSLRWGVPKMMIGATIVSLGTTTPEAAVSVVAAIQGKPGLALGNAVGSIICDTGLVLGTAALIAPLPLNRHVVKRHGWLKLGAATMLVVASLPFSSLGSLFTRGGRLPQLAGIAFLVLLAAYLWQSIRWSRQDERGSLAAELQSEPPSTGLPLMFLKLLLGIFLVIAASRILIPAVSETAQRLRVPSEVIAATLVAFGTSLPELVTAITAARKGHGDLAVGNVIGADILNVLFVSGAAAAVTAGGLRAPPDFFRIHFPVMLGMLGVFAYGIFSSGKTMKRPVGVALLVLYLGYLVLSYAAGVGTGA